MTHSDGPVAVGIDGTTRATDGNNAAIDLGAWEATRRRVDLCLVHASQLVPPWARADLHTDDPRELARRTLHHLVEQTAAAHPTLAVTGAVSTGSPASALIDASATASLVVVSADSRVHYGGLLAGLVSIQVAAHAQAPVIVVPTAGLRPRPASDPRVVVGIDGSAGSADAVAFAFEEAQARHATLHAVYVWEPPTHNGFRPMFESVTDTIARQTAADRMIHDAIAPWEEKYPDVVVIRDAIHGDNPIRALNDAANGADLIVIGPRGHGGFATLVLGSVADGLVRYAGQAVAVARTAGSVVVT